MNGSDARPINLTVLNEDKSLSVSLTDSRSVARFGRIEIDAGLLDQLKSRAVAETRRRIAGASDAAVPGSAADARRKLGDTIFSQLLPADIRTFLLQCPPRILNLQLSKTLLAIPWEIAFDGRSFLGEKFRVARQILSDEQTSAAPPARPDRTVLKVLIIVGGTRLPAPDSNADDLLERLGGVRELAATRVHASELPREEVLQLMGASDVVHYAGPAADRAVIDGGCSWRDGGESIALSEVAALAYPPQLIVAETTDCRQVDLSRSGRSYALAAAACRAGLNLLSCDAMTGGEGQPAFVQELYRELAHGSALAEAFRHATAVARQHAEINCTAYPDAELYGDAAIVLLTPPDRWRQQDDLRQVTIMSHDLVDSTGLLRTLGAERYSELLARYHDRCAQVVARHGGVSDEPQGDDGIMCYFGIPVAHEDSAARALRAGLEILGAAAEPGVSVRIGIATGRVVVKSGQPVGAAVHLAARLQSIAEPGTLVIGDSTRQIVGEQFDLRRLDRVPHLKGFDHPTTVYRVLGESRAHGTERFDSAPRLTPFVGRERELRLLEDHWAAARAGAVRTMLISGEAGIGKSRLVHEFRRLVSLPSHATIECRCTPDHSNSAFHPVIDFLRRLLQIRDSDSVEGKLDKIAGALASVKELDGAVQLIAALLSIPSESRYGPLISAAEKQRQLTLDALVGWLCRRAERAPNCLIVEDIQWVDPSTREFLNRLVAATARLPLLVLATRRSDSVFTADLGFAPHEIRLQGLTADTARSMIRATGGAASIPGDVVGMLVDKTDGVPLYIEESTQMAINLGVGDAAGESAPASRFTVPATLQDLLMARLDQVRSAKPVAQLGGAIGREFSLALIQAVLAHEHSPLRVADLAAELAALVNSGLLTEKGEPPDTRYYFKHALVRDAAYQSLWERDRKQLHRAIAAVVSAGFQNLAESQPELLAFHYAEAGMDSEAVTYWEAAARRAAARSAHAEALSHLACGLAQIVRLPAGPSRDRAELGMQLLLAGQLVTTEGYGAEQVGRVYDRAAELCRSVGDERALMKTQLGLEGYHFMRADFEQAQAIAAQAAARVKGAADPLRRLQSMWADASILFHQGELFAAVEHMDRCLDEYNRLPQRPKAVQDPGVMCLCYSAWGKWQLGHPDQALERARQVVALSEKLGHKFSIGESCGFFASIQHFRGENAQALQYAERAIEVCEDSGFAVWLAHARLMRGRIVAELGDADAGVAEMSRAYDMWSATGAVVTTPFYLAMQAEGFALAGRPNDGLVLLERAFGIVCKYGERYYEAEIRRLLGELILQSAALQGADRNDEAERWILGAIEFAQAKQLHSLSLRSAISLSRLRLAQGRSEEGLQTLLAAYEWFAEGQNTRDLRLARASIETLNSAIESGGN